MPRKSKEEKLQDTLEQLDSVAHFLLAFLFKTTDYNNRCLAEMFGMCLAHIAATEALDLGKDAAHAQALAKDICDRVVKCTPAAFADLTDKEIA